MLLPLSSLCYCPTDRKNRVSKVQLSWRHLSAAEWESGDDRLRRIPTPQRGRDNRQARWPLSLSSLHPASQRPLCTHEAPVDEAKTGQSKAEKGHWERECTGASGSPGRARVWLILAGTRASPSAWAAPMSSSRFMGTSSPTLCRTTAGSCRPLGRTRGGGKRFILPGALCSPPLPIYCTSCSPSGRPTKKQSHVNNTVDAEHACLQSITRGIDINMNGCRSAWALFRNITCLYYCCIFNIWYYLIWASWALHERNRLLIIRIREWVDCECDVTALLNEIPCSVSLWKNKPMRFAGVMALRILVMCLLDACY